MSFVKSHLTDVTEYLVENWLCAELHGLGTWNISTDNELSELQLLSAAS